MDLSICLHTSSLSKACPQIHEVLKAKVDHQQLTNGRSPGLHMTLGNDIAAAQEKISKMAYFRKCWLHHCCRHVRTLPTSWRKLCHHAPQMRCTSSGGRHGPFACSQCTHNPPSSRAAARCHCGRRTSQEPAKQKSILAGGPPRIVLTFHGIELQ